MRKKMDAGKLYDSFPPNQTMTREVFIEEIAKLNNPHLMQSDLVKITMERGRRRTLALCQKNEINKAVGG